MLHPSSLEFWTALPSPPHHSRHLTCLAARVPRTRTSGRVASSLLCLQFEGHAGRRWTAAVDARCRRSLRSFLSWAHGCVPTPMRRAQPLHAYDLVSITGPFPGCQASTLAIVGCIMTAPDTQERSTCVGWPALVANMEGDDVFNVGVPLEEDSDGDAEEEMDVLTDVEDAVTLHRRRTGGCCSSSWFWCSWY